MEIVCVGSGYVGSVTGAAFAALGHRCTVIDYDQNKVKLINEGRSPIYEPGLERLLSHTVQGGTLSASSGFEKVFSADVVFIAVGTPSGEDGAADLTYVKSAARSIGNHLNPDKFTVVVNKSTVPVGTADLVALILEEESGLTEGEQFAVTGNPEFLREGTALSDVFFPDRIVIGTSHPEARKQMRTLYEPILAREGYASLAAYLGFEHPTKATKPVYFETDAKSAEMIKFVSNAFLSVKISYINEVARLCESLGANVLDVAKGMGMDSRIGGKFLEVSSGWSGSCFPKDTSELLITSQIYGSELTLVKAAVDSNRRMHDYCVEKIRRRLKTLNGKKIGVLGLTFKPDTDDSRQTQASYIIRKLNGLGASVTAHDPQGMDMFQKLNSDLPVRYCERGENVAKNADAVILLTHWEQYLKLDWEVMLREMKYPYLFDTRNFLQHLPLAETGFIYEGLGV